jgi:hypothetical protein
MALRMMPLVSLPTAKTHLRITDNVHDAEIQAKLDLATGTILDYLKTDHPDWVDEATTPLPVQAAILKLLGSFYEHRGDDSSTADNHESAVWDEIARLLMRQRDPALA